MNLNKAVIIGRLTRDPETRTMPSGQSVCNFAIATDRFFKDKLGQKQQQTEFHNVVAFGRLGEIAAQYLTKGSLAFIEGRIQNRTWDAPDGTKRYKTEIVTERLQLGPRFGGGGGTQNNRKQTPDKKQSEPETLDTIEYPEENNNPDDIPF